MPKRKDADQIISAIVRYLATGEEPKLSGVAAAYMEGIMPVLARSKERSESGRRGGQAKALANGLANNVANGVANKEANGNRNRNRNRNKELKPRDIGESTDQDSPMSCPVNSENEPKYQEIIDCLNHITGSSFRATTRKTRDLIKARYNEGFTFDDFVSVIRYKSSQWLHEPKMCAYLRPETLFGTKFEGYLQESKAVRHGAFDEYDNRRKA